MSDKALKDTLNALVAPRRPDQAALPPAKVRQPIAGVTGVGRVVRLADAGGGIASPLNEPDASTRTYHSSHYVYSSDGFFTLSVTPLKAINMFDANGSAVQMLFDDPYA